VAAYPFGLSQALEPSSASHSSVAVRCRQCRDPAWWPGQRGM